MKNILIFSYLILSFAACKGDHKQDADENNSNLIKHEDVLLLCQYVKPLPETDTIAASFEVFLQLDESKVKVAEILNCETLTPDMYEQYQIPKQAISAVGGWWAGAGDYLYVSEEEGNYVVKKGGTSEESEDDDFHYQVVAKYSKNGALMTSE